jgi:hypothetical protein
MGNVVRNVKTNPEGTVNRTRLCLLYRDDMVVLGHAVKHIAETVENMTNAASQIRFTINLSKTRYGINRKKY